MKSNLNESLNHPIWKNHVRNKSLYSVKGDNGVYKIVYYPIFRNGKTNEEYTEPRALLQNIKERGFYAKEMPLRYVTKVS